MSRAAPCANWSAEADLLDSCDTSAVTPEVLAEAFTFASFVMFNLTRRRYPGLCSDVYQPFSDNCCWLKLCGHGPVYHGAVRLPHVDVREITQVKIDGAVVAPSEYFLRGRYLMSQRQADGSLRAWPCWQDLNAAIDAADTFTIALTHGADPPAALKTATAKLAWEFALAWTPACAGTCRLPQRVTTLTRAGTTFAIIDPLTVFDKGRTGVPDIDMAIAAEMFGETRKRAFVGRPGSSLNQQVSRRS